MIDFRYHLVSIIAVFFALAVGIVLGAGPLGERIDADLPEQLAASRERSQELQEQIRELEAHQSYRDGFVDAVAAELVNERLRDDVAVVALPGADDDIVTAVEELLTLSGANITVAVQVEAEWTEPEAEAGLDALAAQLVSSGTVLPETGDGYDRGAALLAGALLRPPVDESLAVTNGLEEGTGRPTSAAVDEEVLVGLSEAGFISVDGEPERKARVAVVVAGQAPEEGEDADVAAELEPYLSIVDALEQVGSGVVVAAVSALEEPAGLVAHVRADVELSDRVSTVDSIVLPGGQIALVYATAEQAAGGVGQYGNVDAADGLLPPVPPRAGPAPGADVDDGTPTNDPGDADGEDAGDDGSDNDDGGGGE